MNFFLSLTLLLFVVLKSIFCVGIENNKTFYHIKLLVLFYKYNSEASTVNIIIIINRFFYEIINHNIKVLYLP